MVDFELFATQHDYTVPLLRLLSELPGGQGQASEVCRLFEERYGRRIPEKDRGLRSGGAIIWENNVHWSRQHLKDYGFLDPSQYGIWKIAEEGRRWLKENPQATRITGKRRSGSRPSRGMASSKAPSVPSGITLEMLEQTRKLMPADQFRPLWGVLYDQLVAEERAKAITTITQTELGRRARQRIDEVHAFLQGKNSVAPSGEMLCDWIQFCYALELYREAAALLPFVQETSVDPSIYRRAKRVAEVSRSKTTG